jgi:integrase
MASQKITKTVVQNAKYDCADGRFSVVRDTDVKGFDLRVLPSCKTFVYRYSRPRDRKQRVMKLGRFPDITTTEARRMAEQARADVHRGIDPQQAKDEAKARREAPTFEIIARRWIDEYAKRERKSWKLDDRLLFKPNAYLAPLYSIGFDDRDEFAEKLAVVHSNTSKRYPVQANHVVSLVTVILNEAVVRRWIPNDFRDIGRDIKRNEEKRRKDYIRPPELAPFAQALTNRPKNTRVIIWFLLLTGCRRGEAKALRKADVFERAGVLVFRETKTGDDHELPISKHMEVLLAQSKSDPVFPGTDFHRQFATLRDEVKFMNHITAHALRHTFRTHMRATLEIPLEVVDTITNHKTPGVGAGYVHPSHERRLAALNRYGDWLMEQAGIVDFAAYIRGDE